jgi:hypothetical protein
MTPLRPRDWTWHAQQRFRQRVVSRLPEATPRQAVREAVYAGRRDRWDGWRWRDWVLVVSPATRRVVSVWYAAWWDRKSQPGQGRPRDADVADAD